MSSCDFSDHSAAKEVHAYVTRISLQGVPANWVKLPVLTSKDEVSISWKNKRNISDDLLLAGQNQHRLNLCLGLAAYHRCPWRQRPHHWEFHSSPACCAGTTTPTGFHGDWISSRFQTWRSRCHSWSRVPSATLPGSQKQIDPESWWILDLGFASLRQTPSISDLQSHRGKVSRFIFYSVNTR